MTQAEHTPWLITAHAVEQLRARVLRDVSFDAAERMLVAGMHRSARLKGKTFSGESRYLLSAPRCIAIVRERGQSRDGRRVVVTVLGVDANGRDTGATLPALDPQFVVDAYVPDADPMWEAMRAETRSELSACLLRLAASHLTADLQAAIRAYNSACAPNSTGCGVPRPGTATIR